MHLLFSIKYSDVSTPFGPLRDPPGLLDLSVHNPHIIIGLKKTFTSKGFLPNFVQQNMCKAGHFHSSLRASSWLFSNMSQFIVILKYVTIQFIDFSKMERERERERESIP